MKSVKLWIAVTGLAAAGAVMVTAGPLNPPAGPVGSTYKTLSEVERRVPVQSLVGDSTALYVISQPGSYYLTGSITGASGKNGVRVLASDVTIDLKGFVMGGAGVGGDGVHAEGSLTNVTVRNGSLSNWTGAAVSCGTCSGGLFEGLMVRGSGQGLVIGTGAAANHCVLADLSGTAVSGGSDCRATECVALRTGGIGASDGSFITGCVANEGVTGCRVGSGGGITTCTAHANNGEGITVGYSFVEGCTSTGNGLTTGSEGIESAGTIRECTASRNWGPGIYCLLSETVNCVSRYNASHGILSYAGFIRQNVCVGNGAAGVWAAAIPYSDIEDNVCNSNAGNGISTRIAGYCSVLGNLVAGNTGIPIDTYPNFPGYIGASIGNSSGFVSSDPTANFVF